MKKHKKDAICDNIYNILITYCKEYKIDLKKINERQFRLTLKEYRLDIYPLGKKYFDIYNEVWGVYL